MAEEESKVQSWCLILGQRGEATNRKTPEAQRVWEVLKGAQSPLQYIGSQLS